MAPPARAWAYLLKQPVALVQPGLRTGEPRVRRVPACAACTLKSQAKSVFQRNAVLAQLVLRRTIKENGVVRTSERTRNQDRNTRNTPGRDANVDKGSPCR